MEREATSMAESREYRAAIDGMHCEACVRRVTKALGDLHGVRVLSVEVGSARVLAAPESEQALREAVSKAGFALQSLHGS